MNEGQKQFYHFFLSKAEDNKQDEAKALLNECFEKQASGDFTSDFLSSIIPKMLDTIKPECVQEVKEIMEKFGQGHTS